MSGSRLVSWVLSAALISVLAAQTVVAQDPLKVAPDMYKLLLENDRVRVMEVVFKPGSKIAKHSHPDHFVYVASAGKLTIHKADNSASRTPTSRWATSCGSGPRPTGRRTPAPPKCA